MKIRKAIACLRRELNDLDRLIASIEDGIAANIEKPPRKRASSRRTWEFIEKPTPPAFPAPEFGLWL
jgi:hypothetical protein